MKPVLFDYNGTLYFDADINHIAWKQTIEELTKGTIDFEELYKDYRSVRNYLFVEKVFELMNLPHDKDQIMYWSKRKETQYYQNYCRNNNRDKLSPGAEKLLDYLKENNVPINLCTASLIENVDFYFDYLKLGKWFDKSLIAYDDGTFYDKTQMYKECARRIGFNIEDCVVIEDSPTSIKQAIKAGCKNIIAIRKEDTPELPEIKQIIDDLTQIDKNILR